MTNKPSWQKEFDKWFNQGTKKEPRFAYASGVYPDVTAFIQYLLNRKAREIEKHGYRKNEPGWEKISTEVKFYGMGYNDGLSQAISILKEE